MTELLPLPKLNIKNEIDDSPLTPVESSADKLCNILTNMVRQKYFDFLEKLLAANYESSPSDAVLSSQDIKKCAEYLEFKAVRSCMIVNLYRESILNIFEEIRNDTAQKKLNIHLSTERVYQRKTRRNVQIQTDLRSTPVETNNSSKPAKRRNLRNVRCQTDFVDTNTASTTSEHAMSLDDRIRMFENKFREDQSTHCFPTKILDCQNRFKEKRKRRHSSISLESPHSSIDSSIHRSTERTDSCTDNEGVQLTNSSINNSMAIFATPIESVEYTNDNVAEELTAIFRDDEETDIFGEVISTVDRSHSVDLSGNMHEMDSTDANHMDNATTKAKNQSKVTQDHTNELRNSIWPCELHMQRMKLYKALMKKADKGFKYSEKLMRKFEDLFGPEDDDEDNCFAPYSPTIELDEILMSSCKKRIVPWIVKNLGHMSDGLIANRFLFKKVARHIAEKVILRDQYPDEQLVKRAIDDFFKTHKYIGSIDDIT